MYYVLDENGNKIEAYDKQGVLALLEQAIENGSLAEITSDSGFIDRIKCCVGTDTHKIAFVTQATYNELKANSQLIANAYYFITDDTTASDINDLLATLTEEVNGLSEQVTTISSNIKYLHRIYLQLLNSGGAIYTNIINQNATAITAENLKNSIGNYNIIPATGYIQNNNNFYPVFSISNTSITCVKSDGILSSTYLESNINSINDTVIKIY